VYAIGVAREFMSEKYFYEGVMRNKGLVIAFNRGLHVMLMRLVEVAHEKKVCMGVRACTRASGVSRLQSFSFRAFVGIAGRRRGSGNRQ
jgi:hypothetical protein